MSVCSLIIIVLQETSVIHEQASVPAGEELSPSNYLLWYKLCLQYNGLDLWKFTISNQVMPKLIDAMTNLNHVSPCRW